MKKAIGIDLGTTNSLVAIKDTAIKILRNRENEELTRSCVGLLNTGELLVGSPAYGLLGKNPLNTILSIKRLMGGSIKDETVQEMINSNYYRFAITNLKGGTDDAVAVILGGKQYTPEQISSQIIKKLKSDAEEKLSDEITHAVITVPAYFTEKQKNATRIAAQLAGLKVQKLLAEPTAAAIAFGVDNLKAGEAKTVMIYDFGGGTFDLSILNIVDGQYIEITTGGDRWLGGDDLDKELQKYILNKISEEYNIENLENLIANLPDKKRILFETQMRFQTESAKIQLSSAKTAPIQIDNLLEDNYGDIIDIDFSIKRAEFEKLIKPFIEKSIQLIETLLKEINYDITMVDDILLIGGTSCIPLVKEMLVEKYGSAKIRSSEKPMLAIAEGAAILSHRLGDEYEPAIEAHQTVVDIAYSASHSYFCKLKDKDDLIIEKQTPLPYNVSRTYKTSIPNQKIVKVDIYAVVEEGKQERQTIGFFTIEENLPLRSEIVFDITLDVNHLFDIIVYPSDNRSKKKKVILGRGNLDSKALELIDNNLETIITKDYSPNQRDYYLNAVQKEIEKVDAIGIDGHDSEKWKEIGTNAFSAFEQAESITNEVDEDEISKIFAEILVNQYYDLIGTEITTELKRLLFEMSSENDPLSKSRAIKKIKVITNNYPVLITLYTIKIASNIASKNNPSDAQRLLQFHDQIVIHFKNLNKDEAYAILDEALELRDKYFEIGSDIGSILLTNN